METVTEQTAAEQGKIQQYCFRPTTSEPLGTLVKIECKSYGGYDKERHGGSVVLYEDHVKAMLNPMGLQLTKDDKASFSLLQHIIDNIANEEQSPDFAGFQLSRATNDEGELKFIGLVPCDNIAGIAAPRFSFEAIKAPAIKAATASQLKLVKP